MIAIIQILLSGGSIQSMDSIGIARGQAVDVVDTPCRNEMIGKTLGVLPCLLQGPVGVGGCKTGILGKVRIPSQTTT